MQKFSSYFQSRAGCLKLSLTMIVFFSLLHKGDAQQSKGNVQQLKTNSQVFFEFSGPGMLRVDSVAADNPKKVYLKTYGGFVTYKGTDYFNISPQKYSAHLLRRENVKSTNEVQNILENVYPGNSIGQLYIDVNREFFIEVIDVDTDTIIRDYTISRVKKIPRLQTIRYQDSKKQVYDIGGDDIVNLMHINKNETTELKLIVDTLFKDAEIEFSLVNIDTKKVLTHSVGNNFVAPVLDEKYRYELKFNYVLQPESSGVILFENEAPQRSSILFFGLIGMLFLVVFTVTALLIQRRRVKNYRKKQRKLEDSAIALQASLNPHFTFNALSTIQGLINTGRIDDANFYLQEFGALLRQTLNKSQQVFNTLDQELEMMRLYLRLESLRFNFQWEIIVSPQLTASTIEIPTFLLQPIIENAIKHGVSGLNDSGRIEISCEPAEKTGSFVISIRDNGKWKEKTGETGYGLDLTRRRISTINKIKKNQTLELILNKDTGTEVKLKFHKWI